MLDPRKGKTLRMYEMPVRRTHLGRLSPSLGRALGPQLSIEIRPDNMAHCYVLARDLLMPYGDVVIALSTVLRIKRALDGAEIDALIFDLQARMAAAVEHRRRTDWRNRELAAKRFEAEAYKADAASMPHFAPDRVR